MLSRSFVIKWRTRSCKYRIIRKTDRKQGLNRGTRKVLWENGLLGWTKWSCWHSTFLTRKTAMLYGSLTSVVYPKHFGQSWGRWADFTGKERRRKHVFHSLPPLRHERRTLFFTSYLCPLLLLCITPRPLPRHTSWKNALQLEGTGNFFVD